MKGVEDPRLDPSHGACAHPAWAAGFGGADGLPGEPWYVARGFLVVERVVVAVGGVDVSSTRMGSLNRRGLVSSIDDPFSAENGPYYSRKMRLSPRFATRILKVGRSLRRILIGQSGRPGDFAVLPESV